MICWLVSSLAAALLLSQNDRLLLFPRERPVGHFHQAHPSRSSTWCSSKIHNNRNELREDVFALRMSSAAPSWSDLEQQIFPNENFNELKLPINIDSVLYPNTTPSSLVIDTNVPRPILFRERHGWCPYSERVWWTLELSGVAYDTIRIDNTGHGPQPSYWSGTTPQLRWPGETRNRGESMDLVYALDEHYHQCRLLQSDSPVVRRVVSQFRSIFPRNARPSSRAAFLFQNNGEPLWKSTFAATLQATEELLRETPEGPFLCGATLTAADVAWAPFLERYRYQLPALHGNELDPNCAQTYPALHHWYQAVDRIPSYACRVSGNASSWRKVLTMAGFGNAGNVPPQIRHNMVMLQQQTVEQLLEQVKNVAIRQHEQQLWDAFLAERPYNLAATPASEAAHVILRNRQAILRDALQRVTASNDHNIRDGLSTAVFSVLPTTESGLDTALRRLVQILLHMDDDDHGLDSSTLDDIMPPDVGALAMYLDERMCVPRDMGALSAKRIAQIAAVASSR